MLDVDFVLLSSFRERVRGEGAGELKTLLRTGQAALVLPAFEYVVQEDGLEADEFPKDKKVSSSQVLGQFESSNDTTRRDSTRRLTSFPSSLLQELLQLVADGKIDSFHRSWLPGHSSKLFLILSSSSNLY